METDIAIPVSSQNRRIVYVFAGHLTMAQDLAREENPFWVVVSAKEMREGFWEVVLLR